MDRRQSSQVTTGVVMIALGLIFLANRLNLPYANAFRLHLMWPVVLIAFGAARLFAPPDDRREGRSGGGAWLIFAGVLFLLNNYGVMTLSQSWPLFIVAGGVSILFARERHVGRRSTPEGDSPRGH